MSPAAQLVAVLAGIVLVARVSPACATDDGSGASGDAAVAATSICPTGFLGDRALAPSVDLRALRADGSDAPLRDGGDIEVVTPPQAGRVVFVGIRATNLDGCAVQIFATLRDPVSGKTRVDARTVNLRRESDGSGTSGAALTDLSDYRELGSYAHVPLCPNQWADQDVFDVPFTLEVRVVDREGREITRSATVVPRCAEPGERGVRCRCVCSKDYAPGQGCAADAGAP